MRIVTLEEHVLTPAFARARQHLEVAPPPELSWMMEPALMDLGEGRLRAMDAAGITVQVLSMASTGLDRLPAHEGTALAHDANTQVGAAIRQYPDRFAGFATISLGNVPAAVDEMCRAVEELGFSGIKLQGSVGDVLIDDERFLPVWSAVERLNVPVYLHAASEPPEVMHMYWSGLSERLRELLSITLWEWHKQAGLEILRLIVSGLFDRFTGLRLIVGHMGEHLPSSITWAGGILDLLAMRLKQPVEEYFHRHFWVTTSGYFKPEPFHHSAEIIGMDRMLFATDYPFGSTRRGRKFLESLQLKGPALAQLTHGNADRLFGWA